MYHSYVFPSLSLSLSGLSRTLLLLAKMHPRTGKHTYSFGYTKNMIRKYVVVYEKWNNFYLPCPPVYSFSFTPVVRKRSGKIFFIWKMASVKKIYAFGWFLCTCMMTRIDAFFDVHMSSSCRSRRRRRRQEGASTGHRGNRTPPRRGIDTLGRDMPLESTRGNPLAQTPLFQTPYTTLHRLCCRPLAFSSVRKLTRVNESEKSKQSSSD